MPKLKLYGSVIATAGIIGLIAFLFWQVNGLKSEKAALEWKLITVEAEIDTVFITTTYAVPETTWKRVEKIVYRDSLQVDTVYEDIPIMTGEMSFDTTKVFGEDHNPLSVHVSGQLYYPAEYSHRNWLLIVPEFGKSPVIVSKRRSSKSWGIGLACAISSRGVAFPSISGRINRTSVALYRQIDQNVWMLGLNYEILRF